MHSGVTDGDSATLPIRCGFDTGEDRAFLHVRPQAFTNVGAQYLQCWIAENDNIVVLRYDGERKRIHSDQTRAGVQRDPHRACFLFDHEHLAISHLEVPRERHPPPNLHLRKRRLQLVRDPSRRGRDTRPPLIVEYSNSIHRCHISILGHRQAGLTPFFALIYDHGFSSKDRHTSG